MRGFITDRGKKVGGKNTRWVSHKGYGGKTSKGRPWRNSIKIIEREKYEKEWGLSRIRGKDCTSKGKSKASFSCVNSDKGEKEWGRVRLLGPGEFKKEQTGNPTKVGGSR